MHGLLKVAILWLFANTLCAGEDNPCMKAANDIHVKQELLSAEEDLWYTNIKRTCRTLLSEKCLKLSNQNEDETLQPAVELCQEKHEDHCLGRLDDIDRLLDDGEAMMFMGDIPQSIVQDNERAIDDTCREMNEDNCWRVNLGHDIRALESHCMHRISARDDMLPTEI